MNLSDKNCKPLDDKATPLNDVEVKRFQNQLKDKWDVIHNSTKISKDFKFGNFSEAMNFVNRVAMLAEKENHHPDMHISYNKIKIVFTTNTINGLSENDFIMASKIENIR